MSKKGWIYYTTVNAVPVEVLAEVGNTYRVRFARKTLGLRGHVGPVPKSSVSFVAPHLRGGKKAA